MNYFLNLAKDEQSLLTKQLGKDMYQQFLNELEEIHLYISVFEYIELYKKYIRLDDTLDIDGSRHTLFWGDCHSTMNKFPS